MNYSCILVAAGSGRRSGLMYNKVLYKLDEQTVIEKSIEVFENDEDCQEIILVISEGEKELFEELNLPSKLRFAYGGTERKDSVYHGLESVASDYVMIHDGARPFLKMKYIEKLKEALLNHNAALLMVPTIDTSKRVENGYIVETLKREEIYNAQTPQAFKTSVIKEAYEKLIEDDRLTTDDAQVLEFYSDEKVKVIEGDYTNIKITTEEDIKSIRRNNHHNNI